ncbi:MAG: DNA topoisomerase III [Clostridiales bacterium]|jgi:DNA topoisomerase-3|nr:DNA topoisomerase III [Clostridiales bacterium]
MRAAYYDQQPCAHARRTLWPAAKRAAAHWQTPAGFGLRAIFFWEELALYNLVICEKPSAARSIGAVLGANKRENGYFITDSSVSDTEKSYSAENGDYTSTRDVLDDTPIKIMEGGGFIVAWCFGHLLELAEPGAYGERYRTWSLADLPIVPETWLRAPARGKEAQLEILAGLMGRDDVGLVVNACDAGREGELIFAGAFEYAKCRKPVKRLWISSMEDAAIRAGFANLRDGADCGNLRDAAKCREQADWLVGMNATRMLSILYGAALRAGRVQSPTLAMIASREEAARGFVPEPFYTPEIDCGPFAACGEKQKSPEAAEAVRAAADGRDASVLSVEKAAKTAAPPRLYDLTTLQREANRLFGFTAQQSLDHAQSLYEKKLITYPRTDSRFLGSDMKDGLEKLANLAAMKLPFAKVPVPVNAGAVIDDAKVGDHHAIMPTPEAAKADLSALPAGESLILRLLIARLICAVAPAHKYETATAILECGGRNPADRHRFTAKGRTVLEDGWKAADAAFRATLKNKPGEGDSEGEESAALPELSKGQTFGSVAASVREGKTTPPRPHTEDTLLSAMETAGAEDKADCREGAGEGGPGHFPDGAERKGIGTPATRAAIIEKLVKSGFAERKKKSILPTERGLNLIAALPGALKSPLLTAEWERRLRLVEAGRLAGGEFMGGIAEFVKTLVAENSSPKPELAGLFPESGNRAGAALGPCPRCGSPVREGAAGFFCDSGACGFKLWKNSKFWTAKGKALDAEIAAALLKDGRAAVKGLRSEKTGKEHGAAVILDDSGGKFVNFRLDFSAGGERGRR